MKKIMLLFSFFLLFSCSNSKIKDIAAFEFNNAWYWVIQYEDGTTKQEIEEYVRNWANPNQTAYFFVYDKSIDVSIFAKERFSLQTFAASVIGEPKPKYGFYKMPSDPKLYDDGLDIIKYATK